MRLGITESRAVVMRCDAFARLPVGHRDRASRGREGHSMEWHRRNWMHGWGEQNKGIIRMRIQMYRAQRQHAQPLP